jgi:hypothetical protein
MVHKEPIESIFKIMYENTEQKKLHKLAEQGKLHKDYKNICKYFQGKVQNHEINIDDIYKYMQLYKLSTENLLVDQSKLSKKLANFFINYLRYIKLPNNKLGTYMGEFYIAGTNFVENMSELIQDIQLNDKVKVVAESNNPYDVKAVKVLTENNKKLGYIPKNKNHFPSSMLQNGEKLLGQIKKLEWEQDEFIIRIMLYCK